MSAATIANITDKAPLLNHGAAAQTPGSRRGDGRRYVSQVTAMQIT